MSVLDNCENGSEPQISVALQANYPGKFHQSKVRLLDSMIFFCYSQWENEVLRAQEMRSTTSLT